MLAKKIRLMLVNIKDISFPDNKSGDQVKKFKYQFIDAEMKPHTGYSDTLKFKDRVVDAGEYIDAKAFDYDMQANIFNDVITWRILV